MVKKEEPSPKKERSASVCAYSMDTGTILGEITCSFRPEVDEYCRQHTPDRKAARLLKLRDGAGCLLVLAVAAAIIAGSVWGWKAMEERDMKKEVAACQPFVKEYERLRGEADQVQIPLEFGLTASSVNVTEVDVRTAYMRHRGISGEGAEIAVGHRECFFDSVVRRAAEVLATPEDASLIKVFMPSATACADGWQSPSIGRPGACSWHGGVVSGNPWVRLVYHDVANRKAWRLPVRLGEAIDPVHVVKEHREGLDW